MDSLDVSIDNLDVLVEKNMGLIIKTVSSVTGKYVNAVDDDNFSIALSAFAEAIKKFEPDKGPFASYASLVIKSRLLTYLKKESKSERCVSIEEMQENGEDILSHKEEDYILREEIRILSNELKKFNFTFEDLADKAPKHKDTRDRAIDIAETSSKNEKIVGTLYKKLKLPAKMISAFCGVSVKVVKDSKIFILAVMIVFINKLSYLTNWIKDSRRRNV